MRKYRVSYVYAPYLPKEFKNLEEAKMFVETQIAQTIIETKILFGNWKKIEKAS